MIIILLQKMKHNILLLFILLLLTNQKLYCEVMDKESGLSSILLWTITIISALMGYFISRKKWWYIFISSPFTLMIPFIYYIGCIFELFDPNISSAIIHEAGYWFYVQYFIAPIFVIFGHIFGIITYQRKIRKLL